MKEKYRFYLLLNAEMVNIRVKSGLLNGSDAVLYLAPMIIQNLELLKDRQYTIDHLNAIRNDLNIIINKDRYSKAAISFDEFKIIDRNSSLDNLLEHDI